LAPERVTKEVLLEILTYNNKRYNEIAYVVPVSAFLFNIKQDTSEGAMNIS